MWKNCIKTLTYENQMEPLHVIEILKVTVLVIIIIFIAYF